MQGLLRTRYQTEHADESIFIELFCFSWTFVTHEFSSRWDRTPLQPKTGSGDMGSGTCQPPSVLSSLDKSPSFSWSWPESFLFFFSVCSMKLQVYRKAPWSHHCANASRFRSTVWDRVPALVMQSTSHCLKASRTDWPRNMSGRE